MSLRSAVTSFEQIFVEKPTPLPSSLTCTTASFILNYVTILPSNCYYNGFVNIYGARNGRSSSSRSRDTILHGASTPPLRCLNISFLAFSVFTLTAIKISSHYSVGSARKEGRKEASKVKCEIKRFEQNVGTSIIYINSQARRFIREFNRNKKRYWLLNDQLAIKFDPALSKLIPNSHLQELR